MAVTYKKLFQILKEREMKPIELQKKCGFSGNIMTRIRRDKYVSLESVETICRILDCEVTDILQFYIGNEESVDAEVD